MRLLKSHVLLRLFNSYLIDSPEPANISYLWNFGSLLGMCLIIQILTGSFLAMHYQPHVDFAFSSVEHIMRDVNAGYIIRYCHANVASFFFIFVYAHIGRGLYYGSYRSPRVLLWSIGVIILVLMMAIAFLGYVLPYGQMSLWGATVITNLLSAIPVFGQDLVELIWGGFSVSNATLNRFFSLHFLLPFLLAALVVAHLIALHLHGSNNPNGINSNGDRFPFHPYFVFKDLVTIYLFLLALSIIVFYAPNALGQKWPNVILLIVNITFICAICWKNIINYIKLLYLIKIHNKTVIVSGLFIINIISKYIIENINPITVKYYYEIFNQQITKILNNIYNYIINCFYLYFNYIFNCYLLLVGISETLRTQKNNILKNINLSGG